MDELSCRFCAHTWVPRVSKPKKCPRCAKYGYDLPVTPVEAS